ncbi:MAG: thioredoxin domain-containing protein [Chloroflexi bacterium]|nr:thioredoxin domain-containing protein [Chloroflexota bacterium]
MTNRLANETSPYLLQHAENPVDWYPWGEEALGRAKAEDRPILLSVGYSACHWCHVMERESFEDPAIAGLMNENFVCIKVDREERPDIDSIYMAAVQAMTGQGGWPMTVFLTPDGEPFYGGTYFPPNDRGGLPSFPRLLTALAGAYREKRSDVANTTEQLIQRMRHTSSTVKSLEPLTSDLMYSAFRGIAGNFDDVNGGVGMQPKFPQPMTYEFLLRYHLRSEDADALDIVELTLEKMAQGGIYDQIGGGFHRYATDSLWLVPHFEKMLYDNALLVKLYLHAYQVTRKPLYRRIVEETLEYVSREMTSPEGGFYSSQDADSEGVEGKFFVWSPAEVDEVLGAKNGEVVRRYYSVTPEGNFEGRNILHIEASPEEVAAEFGLSVEELDQTLSDARGKLLEARSRRIAPGLDDKVLTSWNAMMLRAFAEAASVLDRPDYGSVARKNAEFLLDRLRPDGRLLRTFKDGVAKLNGYLEDYAFLIDGLIALHEFTFEARWLTEAVALTEQMVELFWDESTGQLFDTGSDHEALIVRPRDFSDNATPSGSSMASDVLLKMAVITGNQEHERKAVTGLRSVREMMLQFPSATGHWLCALDFYLSSTREIAIIGERETEDTSALVAEVYRHFLPNRVFLGSSGADGEDASQVTAMPLLEGRERVDGRATAYVCESYVCSLPTSDAQELAKLLVT